MKYRKKPVVVDAIRFWNGDGPSMIQECLKFCEGAADFCEESINDGGAFLAIYTMGRVRRAYDGYWIVNRAPGDFVVRSPDLFERLYEKVDEDGLTPADHEALQALGPDPAGSIARGEPIGEHARLRGAVDAIKGASRDGRLDAFAVKVILAEFGE